MTQLILHFMGDEPMDAFCSASAEADATGFIHLTPVVAKVNCPACLVKMRPAPAWDLPRRDPNVTLYEEPGWPSWWPVHSGCGGPDCARCDLEREAMEDNVYEQQLAVYDDANAWRADA